jgi:hypothetical protein
MTSWPGRLAVGPSSGLDDDVQGAQFLAPRIPNQALPKIMYAARTPLQRSIALCSFTACATILEAR